REDSPHDGCRGSADEDRRRRGRAGAHSRGSGLAHAAPGRRGLARLRGTARAHRGGGGGVRRELRPHVRLRRCRPRHGGKPRRRDRPPAPGAGMTRRARCLPPRLRFKGQEWAPEALDATARAWWAELRAALPDTPPLVATVLPVHPEGVALFFALS